MKRWLIGLSLAALACAAQALPTVAQVESEVQKGNYAQAQSMMHDVVVAKPGSARAHYIYAEILAHNDQFAQAAQEATLAKQLDPALKFTSPDRFAAFEQLLEREQQHATTRGARGGSGLDNLGPGPRAAPALTAPVLPRETAPASSGLPGWALPAGLVLLAVLAWNWLRRSRTAGPVPASAGYAPATGYAPGGVPTGPAPSAGGSWMGTGLAAAGGVAAGMLAEKLLEHGHDGRRDDALSPRDGSYGPVESADTDARALENRNVDFGSGGNDWDDASGGGSVDLGGGGDDGGW